MSDSRQDPALQDLREQVFDTDQAIVAAVNRRLELVALIKQHKTQRGYELIDAAREEWLLAHLARANPGPLSDEGLREFYAGLLELTKREVAF
jgi:chorismate mutase